MNIHQLRVFYEVAKEGSFSIAAEKLHLTQPAVTWQIKGLEDSYDLKFLDRIGKKVLLTEEGKVLFDYADRILNLTREAEEALVDLKGLSLGNLRLASTFTFGDFYLPALLETFHRRYPKITIQISTGNSSQIIENTLLHKNDLAIIAHDPSEEKLEVREIITDLLMAIVSTTHPLAKRKSISLKELNGQRLLLREKGSLHRSLIDEILARRGISPQIIMESASTSAIKKMVENGVAMAILSQQVVKKEMKAGSLKKLPFSDAQITYRFYLIHHKDKYLSRALKAFIELAMEFSRKPWPD
ncbi:MAG: LysR family transcriptional regulator [Proteobacteria bacterium]|nr:LysR family transcriptional regulator [Pseudomonadota bacterium]